MRDRERDGTESGLLNEKSSERKSPSGVEHASGVIVAGVTWIGNDLQTYRELVILADLKTMEELEDGLIPRGFITWNRQGKSRSREVILPAAKATESQPGLCRLPHIGKGPVRVGIPREDLKFVAKVLIKDDCHSIVFRQTQVCPCAHVPQPDRIPAFPKPFEGGGKANLAESEDVPSTEKGVNLSPDGLAVSVARAGGNIKKVGWAD